MKKLICAASIALTVINLAAMDSSAGALASPQQGVSAPSQPSEAELLSLFADRIGKQSLTIELVDFLSTQQSPLSRENRNKFIAAKKETLTSASSLTDDAELKEIENGFAAFLLLQKAGLKDDMPEAPAQLKAFIKKHESKLFAYLEHYNSNHIPQLLTARRAGKILQHLHAGEDANKLYQIMMTINFNLENLDYDTRSTQDVELARYYPAVPPKPLKKFNWNNFLRSPRFLIPSGLAVLTVCYYLFRKDRKKSDV